jgi:hypothetical protein
MYALTYLLIPQLVSAAAINGRGNPNRAAYFLNNDPAGASIVSLKINPNDGTLSSPVVTWTGGKGLYGLTASSTGGAPAAGGAGMNQDPLMGITLKSSRYLVYSRLCSCLSGCECRIPSIDSIANQSTVSLHCQSW